MPEPKSAIDTSLIKVGAPTEGGCCYINFTNETIPTTATDSMDSNTNFVSLGDVSENGFTESRSISSTNHKDWGGQVVLTSINSDEITYKLELLEINRAAAAKLRYGADAVKAGADGSVSQIDMKAYDGKGYPIVIDEIEANGYLRRTVIKKGIVTSFDDMTHQKGSLLLYGMTITANTPSDGSDPVVIYRAKPTAASTGK